MLMNHIPQLCLICHRWLSGSLALCEHCVIALPWTQPKPPYFSAFTYQSPIKEFIQLGKYHNQLIYLDTLAQLLTMAIQTHYDPCPDIIIPIPLHAKKTQQRGFNQTLLIAQHVAKSLDIKLVNHTLKRDKATNSQSQLNFRQRQKNVINAFSWQACPSAQNIILLDDVITTGATIEAARSAIPASLQVIDCWCIAKQQLK